MKSLDNIRKQFKTWNKKNEINIGNNKLYKVIGCGKSAFKVIKFEPQSELNNKGGWSQVFWNYNDIAPGSDADKVISKMESMM